MDVLGIDIGGSGIKGAIINTESGALITERYRLPTPEKAQPKDVAKVVAELVAHFKYRGVFGCGFPAIIRKGTAFSAANVSADWIGTDAAALFTKASGMPAYVLNDADAAGIAEMRFGAGKGQGGVVMVVTLGTGIGSAIFVDGKLLPNSEFGHMSVRGKDAEHRASDAVRQAKNLSWKKYAARLEEVINQMDLLVSPDLIIVGGGISKQADEFLPLLKVRPKMVPAQLLNQAGIIGAAMYAAEQQPAA